MDISKPIINEVTALGGSWNEDFLVDYAGRSLGARPCFSIKDVMTHTYSELNDDSNDGHVWFSIANKKETKYIIKHINELEYNLDYIFIAQNKITKEYCHPSSCDSSRHYKLVWGINRERINIK